MEDMDRHTPWTFWMKWWSWIPGLAQQCNHGQLHPWRKKQWYHPSSGKKNKLLFLGAIIEMDLQCGFPCGLVCQGVGINGQHLGGCHGHEMMVGGWNKVLGTNGAIM